YDNRGSLTYTTRDYGTGSGGWLNVNTSTQYDAFGRVTQSTDGNNNTTTIAYNDPLGHKVTVTDPLIHTAVTTYDAYGRVLTQTDALNNVTSYAYTDATQTVVVTDAQGNTVTTIANRHGQTIQVQVKDSTNAVVASTTYGFDLDGNQVTTTDALGNTT